jgi:hypothetical protein
LLHAKKWRTLVVRPYIVANLVSSFSVAVNWELVYSWQSLYMAIQDLFFKNLKQLNLCNLQTCTFFCTSILYCWIVQGHKILPKFARFTYNLITFGFTIFSFWASYFKAFEMPICLILNTVSYCFFKVLLYKTFPNLLYIFSFSRASCSLEVSLISYQTELSVSVWLLPFEMFAIKALIGVLTLS